jgi:sulfite reductase alpha subunit-like flavoprotein
MQLLIALVEYKTNLSIPRVGLCSSWLPKLPEGTRIPYEILPPTLFLPSPETPVILVGPGTGVAPMRALLEARVAQGAARGKSAAHGRFNCYRMTDTPDTALYFGCRSVKEDLYFADDWEAHRAGGAIVRIAPSRDGAEKLYVQHLLRKDAKTVNDWIVNRRGHIYVCG